MLKSHEELVEAVARAMMVVSRPNADPDDLTPAPRGTAGLVPKWRLFEHLAEAAIPPVIAGCAEVVKSFKHGGENYAFYSDLFEALPDIATAIREMGER